MQGIPTTTSNSLLLGTSLAWLKLDADTVHTVALISGCWEALPLEHMAQVATAVLASDLNTCHAKGAVLMALNCVGQVVIERWPAATRVELGVRPAEACQGVPDNNVESIADDHYATRANTAHAMCNSMQDTACTCSSQPSNPSLRTQSTLLHSLAASPLLRKSNSSP